MDDKHKSSTSQTFYREQHDRSATPQQHQPYRTNLRSDVASSWMWRHTSRSQQDTRCTPVSNTMESPWVSHPRTQRWRGCASLNKKHTRPQEVQRTHLHTNKKCKPKMSSSSWQGWQSSCASGNSWDEQRRELWERGIRVKGGPCVSHRGRRGTQSRSASTFKSDALPLVGSSQPPSSSIVDFKTSTRATVEESAAGLGQTPSYGASSGWLVSSFHGVSGMCMNPLAHRQTTPMHFHSYHDNREYLMLSDCFFNHTNCCHTSRLLTSFFPSSGQLHSCRTSRGCRSTCDRLRRSRCTRGTRKKHQRQTSPEVKPKEPKHQ